MEKRQADFKFNSPPLRSLVLIASAAADGGDEGGDQAFFKADKLSFSLTNVSRRNRKSPASRQTQNQRLVGRNNFIVLDYAERDGAILFSVRVVPRVSQTEIVGVRDATGSSSDGDALKIRLAAAPV